MTSVVQTVFGEPAISSLLEAAGVWLWDCNLLDDTTEYQAGFWEHYGHDPRRMTDTFEFLNVMHNRDIRAVTKAWRAHVDGDTEAYQSHWRMRTGTGEWRWIQANGRVVEWDAAGRPTRMVGAYTDVTLAKRAQNALVDSNAELAAMFKSARDGLVVVAPDLTILRLNEAAMELLHRFAGYRPTEGDSVTEMPAVLPGRPVLHDIELAVAGRRKVPDREVHLEGEGLWLEVSYQPVFHPNGGTMGVLVTLRETTERRRLEQARSHALRMESMGLMAGGIAHDFNNLLAAIIGNIEVALLDPSAPDVRDGLEDARAAARRASELVTQLLQFAGKHEPVISSVDLSALTHEICRYVRKIPGVTIPVHEELRTDLPAIQADASQLRQVVLNLLVNAVDATQGSGTAVTVRTRSIESPADIAQDFLLAPQPAASYLVLQVSDDGPGIDEQTQLHLFDPFFTTKPTGHGLGLPTVLGAVRSHGGSIAVHSEAGHGATFTVILPAS